MRKGHMWWHLVFSICLFTYYDGVHSMECNMKCVFTGNVDPGTFQTSGQAALTNTVADMLSVPLSDVQYQSVSSQENDGSVFVMFGDSVFN